MNAVEIEEAISALAEEPFDPAEFPFLFLQAFGNKDTTIKRLRSGASNKSDLGGVLQTNNIRLAPRVNEFLLPPFGIRRAAQTPGRNEITTGKNPDVILLIQQHGKPSISNASACGDPQLRRPLGREHNEK
jgi:hypothetical protein